MLSDLLSILCLRPMLLGFEGVKWSGGVRCIYCGSMSVIVGIWVCIGGIGVGPV
jgi:hypothetical protein